MGQVRIITPEQELLLDEVRKDRFLSSIFYFTGGTALSLYYLQHRKSIDLDFFSQEKFDPQVILDKMTLWEKKLHFIVDYLAVENTQIFNLIFSDKRTVKVDFAFYPYKRVEKSKIVDNLAIDSLLDISINKLLAIEQRTEVKDFADLYFLLKEFTIWDLLEGVRVKFKVKMDPFVVGADLLKVETFDFLPEMIKLLTLEELRSFFRQKAKEISGKSLE
ncbi:nucleotidyl transferase AbiEii/AbiGii toxin family protein [Candidatus Microgenomates bacterium]|nr:nucleotidyl transferase AbiEii/AbiGii toxin family protein [Candidatus Microgenomates bacterium]